MAKRKVNMPRMDFEKLIGFGENPKGFTSQTANGTAHWNGTGWNSQPNYDSSQIEPKPAWPAGRSNRTGE